MQCTSADSLDRNYLNNVASLALSKGPVLGNPVTGLQKACTHTEDNMLQNKEERNSSWRVCETIVRLRQWKTNLTGRGNLSLQSAEFYVLIRDRALLVL